MADQFKVNEITSRAIHTFWQTFVVVFLGGIVNVLADFIKGISIGRAALLALVLSAVAAGLSSIKTYLITP